MSGARKKATNPIKERCSYLFKVTVTTFIRELFSINCVNTAQLQFMLFLIKVNDIKSVDPKLFLQDATTLLTVSNLTRDR